MAIILQGIGPGTPNQKHCHPKMVGGMVQEL